MSERQQSFRLGLFVLVTLGMLGGLVVVFGGAPSWFKKSNQYTVLFSDAPGIAKGTPVRKSGVKVGEVSSVALDDSTGQVSIVVHLDPKFTPRNSDEPTVTRGLLVGDTAIDFIPKTSDKHQISDPYPPGSTLQGISPFNARLLIDQATGVVPEAQKSLEQVRKSLAAMELLAPQMEITLKQVAELAKASKEFIPELKRTNDGLRELFADTSDVGPSLKTLVPEFRKTNDEIRYFLKMSSFWIEEAGVTIKKHEPRFVKAIDTLTATTEKIGETFSPENQKAIAETLKNVKEASGRFDKLATAAEELMKDGKTAMKSLNSTLTQADKAITEFRQTASTFTEQVGRILQNVEAGSEQFGKTMAEARELIKAIGRAEGTFQKFITDPTLYNNLNETTALLGKLVPRLDRILRDVEVFADKIARHPETIGVGGAIRPSSGLKEGPSSLVPRPYKP